MSTASVPKSKPCNRCGEMIIWNPTSQFMESLAFPKFQHCCKLPCNKQGCGGSIYFSKLCPVNPETGRPRPLDFPVPQIDPNNPAQMIWVVHVHKNNVAADTTPAVVPPQAPATVVPPTGQESLVAHIPVQGENKYVEAQKNPVAQTANKDVDSTLLTAVNDMNLRLGALEQYQNSTVVPVIQELVDVLKNVVPKLNVIAGKIAEGSIKSASDLVAHHLEQ